MGGPIRFIKIPPIPDGGRMRKRRSIKPVTLGKKGRPESEEQIQRKKEFEGIHWGILIPVKVSCT